MSALITRCSRCGQHAWSIDDHRCQTTYAGPESVPFPARTFRHLVDAAALPPETARAIVATWWPGVRLFNEHGRPLTLAEIQDQLHQPKESTMETTHDADGVQHRRAVLDEIAPTTVTFDSEYSYGSMPYERDRARKALDNVSQLISVLDEELRPVLKPIDADAPAVLAHVAQDTPTSPEQDHWCGIANDLEVAADRMRTIISCIDL